MLQARCCFCMHLSHRESSEASCPHSLCLALLLLQLLPFLCWISGESLSFYCYLQTDYELSLCNCVEKAVEGSSCSHTTAFTVLHSKQLYHFVCSTAAATMWPTQDKKRFRSQLPTQCCTHNACFTPVKCVFTVPLLPPCGPPKTRSASAPKTCCSWRTSSSHATACRCVHRIEWHCI